MYQTLERLVEVSHQSLRPVTQLDTSQIASGFAAALDKSLHDVTQKLDALGQQFNAAVNFSAPALLQPASAPSHADRCEVVASGCQADQEVAHILNPTDQPNYWPYRSITSSVPRPSLKLAPLFEESPSAFRATTAGSVAAAAATTAVERPASPISRSLTTPSAVRADHTLYASSRDNLRTLSSIYSVDDSVTRCPCVRPKDLIKTKLKFRLH